VSRSRFRSLMRKTDQRYCPRRGLSRTNESLRFPSSAAAIRPPIASDARRRGSASRCAYRCVVDAWVCPNSLPMIGNPRRTASSPGLFTMACGCRKKASPSALTATATARAARRKSSLSVNSSSVFSCAIGDEALSARQLFPRVFHPARRRFALQSPPMRGGEDRHRGARTAASLTPGYAPTVCR
jgi:hypothetical protein